MKKIKYKEEEFDIEDKKFLLIQAIRELTLAIGRLANK